MRAAIYKAIGWGLTVLGLILAGDRVAIVWAAGGTPATQPQRSPPARPLQFGFERGRPVLTVVLSAAEKKRVTVGRGVRDNATLLTRVFEKMPKLKSEEQRRQVVEEARRLAQEAPTDVNDATALTQRYAVNSVQALWRLARDQGSARDHRVGSAVVVRVVDQDGREVKMAEPRPVREVVAPMRATTAAILRALRAAKRYSPLPYDDKVATGEIREAIRAYERVYQMARWGVPDRDIPDLATLQGTRGTVRPWLARGDRGPQAIKTRLPLLRTTRAERPVETFSEAEAIDAAFMLGYFGMGVRPGKLRSTLTFEEADAATRERLVRGLMLFAADRRSKIGEGVRVRQRRGETVQVPSVWCYSVPCLRTINRLTEGNRQVPRAYVSREETALAYLWGALSQRKLSSAGKPLRISKRGANDLFEDIQVVCRERLGIEIALTQGDGRPWLGASEEQIKGLEDRIAQLVAKYPVEPSGKPSPSDKVVGDVASTEAPRGAPPLVMRTPQRYGATDETGQAALEDYLARQRKEHMSRQAAGQSQSATRGRAGPPNPAVAALLERYPRRSFFEIPPNELTAAGVRVVRTASGGATLVPINDTAREDDTKPTRTASRP